MSSRGLHRRHTAQFKLQLCSDIRSGSISYSEPMAPATLRHALATGTISPKHIAQMRAVVDEAPLSMLSAAVAQTELESGVQRKATWRRMRQPAAVMACTRDILS